MATARQASISTSPMFRASLFSAPNSSSSSCLTFLLTAYCSLLFRSLNFLDFSRFPRSRRHARKSSRWPWSNPPAQTWQINYVSVMSLAVCRTLFSPLSFKILRGHQTADQSAFSQSVLSNREFSGFTLISLLVYTQSFVLDGYYIFHKLKCH